MGGNMEQQQHQSKVLSGCNASEKNGASRFPDNLFLDSNIPPVNLIPVDHDKIKKIKIDPNELLIEFHCEV